MIFWQSFNFADDINISGSLLLENGSREMKYYGTSLFILYH